MIGAWGAGAVTALLLQPEPYAKDRLTGMRPSIGRDVVRVPGRLDRGPIQGREPTRFNDLHLLGLAGRIHAHRQAHQPLLAAQARPQRIARAHRRRGS